MLGVEVGHSGTLDPQVSGVLLVMTGKAVRLAPLLLKHEKEYVCLMRLHGDAPANRMDEVFKEFTGKDLPATTPKKCGRTEPQDKDYPFHYNPRYQRRLVLFRVRCDAGTYIRSLCHHIGLILGTGAHMQELRRTKSGVFDEGVHIPSMTLPTHAESYAKGDETRIREMIRPVEEGVTDQPSVVIRDTAVDAVLRGAGLAAVGIISKDQFNRKEMVAIKTKKGEFVGIGEALVDSTKFGPGENGLVIAPRIVFMAPGDIPERMEDTYQSDARLGPPVEPP